MSEAPDYRGFTEAITSDLFSHMDVEACDIFDLAKKYHIIRKIEGGFNPEIHDDEYGGAEPGDDWYEWNTRPAPTVEELEEEIMRLRELLLRELSDAP